MKKILKAALLFLTLTALDMQAQDYSPFVYDNTSLFQFPDKIEAFQEEPTPYVPDPRGYAINLLQAWKTEWDGTSSGSCNAHNIATWAGPKFTKGYSPTLAGNYFFYNKSNETITFSPLKDIGGTWRMYTYANGNYIQATISNKEYLTFLELTDSVKTISLQLKNSSGTDVSDPVNNIMYKVSKNYGLVQLTRFLNFPTATAAGQLIGLTIPKKGFQLISSREIFKFDLGDEFHYDSLYQSNFLNLVQHIYTINTVTNTYTSANNDTVVYTFDQQKHIHSLNTQTFEETDEYSSGTVQQKYILSKKLLYPGQANLGVEKFLNGAPYWLTLFPDDNNRSQWNTNGEWFKPAFNDPTCWGEIAYDPVHSYYYLEGCGLLEDYQHAWGQGFPVRYKRLVYFKKGEEQWGDALNIITSSHQPENTKLSLFPNPLKQGEELHLETGIFKTKQATIYNSTGTYIKDVYPTPNTESIDISELQPGFYIIQLLNQNNELISSKLIIK